jgi:phosphatidylinositol alpha-1,6-mannosyltransferase
LKILLYTHEFPPFRGGAGIYSRDLAVGLKSLGREVHVATPVRPSMQEDALETAALDGLHLHYMTQAQASPARARIFLARLQLRHRFDLTLVTERRAQEIFASMPPGAMRYAAAVHGTEMLDYFGGKRTGLAMKPGQMRGFYDGAALCIAGSHATLALARRLMAGDRPVVVAVQYGIDTGRLPPVRTEDARKLREKYGQAAEVVFCLGRLDLDKGQEVLMRAFQEVRRARPRARLLIGGDGPARRDLLQLRSELGLEDGVEFLGLIPPAELPAYFGLCDLFALTSRSENRWEGFGLVYLEAGYYGKAVLGGNEGGVPEAIDDGQSGLLVAPRDVQAVASAMQTLLGDESLRRRMGEHGRQRVISHFNSSRMAKETLAHLENALQGMPPRSWPRARIRLMGCLLRDGLHALAGGTL